MINKYFRGHSLSLASEWIENPEGNFDKQDCEQKAFARLAAKIKKQYPRLDICILADGLYPNSTGFNTQIAHAINQFIEKSALVVGFLKRHSKETLRNIWSNLVAYMLLADDCSKLILPNPT